MSDFPSIPLNKQTEKNVKLFLDGLAGRMGIEGRAITVRDLMDAGLVQLKPGLTIDNIGPNINPVDVIAPPTGVLPDAPTVPDTLGTSSSWGAIFLDWQYEPYANPQGTEIWRSPANDRTTATLIAIATGFTYKDIVGAQAVSYYYWIRNRTAGNVISGFNRLEGTLGSANLRTTVEDFLLADPENEFKPFSIIDVNNDPANPDFKLYLNSDVLVRGDLAIGQLITGTMPEGVEFTIGNGSIVMSTDVGSGKSLGSILVTGDGGIDGNDFLRISSGAIYSEVWDEDLGVHFPYKELKRIERGQTKHNQPTRIKPYFKLQPTVYITPVTIDTYDPGTLGAQRLVIDPGAVTKSSPWDGSWWFTPTATLYAAANIVTLAETYSVNLMNDDTDDYTSLLPAFAGAQAVSVAFTVGSSKLLTDGTWKNRQVTITLYGELNGVGGYNQIGTTTVDLNGDGTTIPVVLSVDPITTGSWKFKYDFVAADRAGTTDSTLEVYDYAEDSSTTGSLPSITTDTAQTVKEAGIINYRPTRDTTEWTLYAIDYTFGFSWKTEAWCVQIKGGSFPEFSSGLGVVRVPDVVANMETRRNCLNDGVSTLCDSFPPASGEFYAANSGSGIGGPGNISVSPSDPLYNYYLQGRYTSDLLNAQGTSDGTYCLSGSAVGTGRAHVQINSYDVTYYYRKQKVLDYNTYNLFQVDSITVDAGAISIAAEETIINWLAAGE